MRAGEEDGDKHTRIKTWEVPCKELAHQIITAPQKLLVVVIVTQSCDCQTKIVIVKPKNVIA